MRLLMTTDTVGGVWTFAKELTKGLLEYGWEIALVAIGPGPSAEQLADVDVLKTFGAVAFVACSAVLEWMPVNAEAYSAAEPLLLELCQRFLPDAILLNQFCFGALPVHVPKLVVAHSDVMSWAAAVGKAPLPFDAWLNTYLYLVQSGLSAADAIIAPTAAALRSTAESFQLPAVQSVIPNGRRLLLQSGSGKQMQAVSAGRLWDPAKNLNLLRQLNTSTPLLVAGEWTGASEHLSNVHWVGRLREEEVLNLFQQSAIYICCSLYEPFGLAALEAALCGCAILAFDIPSLREVWGEAALYFEDASSLDALLAGFDADQGLLRRKQTEALARARIFTAERMVASYAALIQQRIAATTEEHDFAA